MWRFISCLLAVALAAPGAELYLQGGYQRTGSFNDPFGGIGVAASVHGPVQFIGELNGAPVSSGKAFVSGSTVTASGRTSPIDLDAGLRVGGRAYLLGSVGFAHYISSGTATANSGPPPVASVSGTSTNGALITFGAGTMFGSGKVRVGPEVRYLRYTGSAGANAARIGLVIHFGK